MSSSPLVSSSVPKSGHEPSYVSEANYYSTNDNDRHRVHLIVSHLIFCPKRRRRVLVGPVQKRLEQIIHEVISEQSWHLVELAIQPDHVHVFVRTSSTTQCEKLSVF